MCGILGRLARNAESEEAAFQAALDVMTYRGPDDSGVFHHTRGDWRLSLGQRRLSILDLSSAGHQPMITPSGTVMVYNGEIYNHLDIRAQQSGYQYKGHADTETMLAEYEAKGLEFTQNLNGMFAVAIWDPTQNRLVLARDRIGIKPLYYYWDGVTLAFASELTALAALPGLDLEIDHHALSQFLLDAYIPAPLSIYRKVRKLGAGHRLIFDLERGEPREEMWWDGLSFYEKELPFASQEEVLDALMPELEMAVSRRLLSDVPLGTFLSGGVDSSLVTALAARVSGEPVNTFTIGFYEDQWNEAPAAAAIAEHLSCNHHELYFSEERILATAREAWRFQDEPFADPAVIPTLTLSQMTRDHVTVALSGDGGDELFWGYTTYSPPTRLKRIYSSAPAAVRRLMAGWAGSGSRKMKSQGYLYGFEDLEDWYLGPKVWRPGLHHADLHVEAGPREKARLGRTIFDKLNHRDWITQTGAVDAFGSLPDQMLTKVDRASMAYSLEVRTPILDHRVFELAAGIPARFKQGAYGHKTLLKTLLDRLLPTELWDRPKKGFGVPLGLWTRGVLKDWVMDETQGTDTRLRDWLDPAALDHMVAAHMRGEGNYERVIWACLQLAGWDRRMKDIQNQTRHACISS